VPSAAIPSGICTNVIATIIGSHIPALHVVGLPRSRLMHAVHECSRRLVDKSGCVSAQSMIVIALLLCPGASQEKQAFFTLLIPDGHEVRAL
jgi:hypothetical protein